MYTIQFFNDSIDLFLSSIEEIAHMKTVRSLDLLREFGHTLRMPHVKKLENDLFELRIHGKQEIRLFFTFHSRKIIILSGFVKKTQKTPAQEISNAKKKLKAIDNI